MKTNHIGAKLKFGSHLYGTATEMSDTDYKTFFVPNLKKYIAGERQDSFKVKKFADGKIAGPNDVMGAGCVEEEFVPINEFFLMVAAGEVQSIECFFAILQGRCEFIDPDFLELCLSFEEKFMADVPIYNMVAFARKSTIDYVLRADRSQTVQRVLEFFKEFSQKHGFDGIRLDSEVEGKQVIDHLRDQNLPDVTFGEVAVSKASSTMTKCFYVVDRCFVGTTPLFNIINSIAAISSKYGHRVRKVEGKVEWKSMCHSIRTFQQAMEFVNTGEIVFPRPNVEFLKSIVRGNRDEEEVTSLLRDLELQLSVVKKKNPVVITGFLMGEVFDYINANQG